MAIISGGKIIEGARHRGGSVDIAAADVVGVTVAGVPVDGVAGTGVGVAGIGSQATDITNGDIYINTGTKASPVWKLVTRAA